MSAWVFVNALPSLGFSWFEQEEERLPRPRLLRTDSRDAAVARAVIALAGIPAGGRLRPRDCIRVLLPRLVRTDGSGSPANILKALPNLGFSWFENEERLPRLLRTDGRDAAVARAVLALAGVPAIDCFYLLAGDKWDEGLPHLMVFAIPDVFASPALHPGPRRDAWCPRRVVISCQPVCRYPLGFGHSRKHVASPRSPRSVFPCGHHRLFLPSGGR
ncbi:hypothetical protein V8F20_003310 [Naviculisporaceae sp. PSN 640]